MNGYALLFTTAFIATSAAAQDNPVDLGTVTLNAGQRDERALLDSPVSATVIDRETLERRQAQDFNELIGDVPGVLIFGGPRSVSHTPSIRGFSDRQVVLRFDGGRMNFGQAHRGRFFLDPDLVQRVEVVRGGGSTLYGSGALGGVIAVETRDAADLLRPGQTTGARVSFGSSSNGDILKRNLSVYGDYGMFDFLAFAGDRRMGDDFERGEDEGEIGASQVDLQNSLLKFGFEPNPDHRIELSLSQYEDDGELPPNSSNVSDPDENVERDASQRTQRLSWDFKPEGNELIDLSVLYYANQLTINEDRDRDGREDETTYNTRGLEVTNRSSFDIGLPVDLVYGFEIFDDEQEGERNGEARNAFPNATARTVGIFAEGTFQLSESLDLIAGLRHDHYTRDPDDDSLDKVDERFTSPRIGLSYRPNDNWQIFGNVSRAFRAPSLSEIYNDGTHFAFGGFPTSEPSVTVIPGFPPTIIQTPGNIDNSDNTFVPNPDLKPEVATQFEIGARFSDVDVARPGDSLNVSVTAYNAQVNDFIDIIVEDFPDSPSSVTPGFPFNQRFFNANTITENADARLWGLEAELDYDAQRWYIRSGLSINRGERDDGGNLGSIPQDRLTATIGFRPSADWDLGARATFAADQDDTPETVAPGEAWERLDLYAIWEPTSEALNGTKIQFGVDNAFDADYTIYPNNLPQPGRTFKITASYQF